MDETPNKLREQIDRELEHMVMQLEMRETHRGNVERKESVSASRIVARGGEDRVSAGAIRHGTFNGGSNVERRTRRPR